jgi:hypothetical protein
MYKLPVAMCFVSHEQPEESIIPDGGGVKLELKRVNARVRLHHKIIPFYSK